MIARRLLDTGLALDLTALIAGAVLTLAFAPLGWYPLAYLTPALLLILWFKSTPVRALWRGWLFGLGTFGVGVHWVYYSLHDFGNADPLFAAFSTFLLVAYLSFYPAAQGWVLRRICQRLDAAAALLWFPASWVLAEYLRERMLSGFPWLSLGYSQIGSPLRELAPILGVSGVSLAAVFCAGALALLFRGSARGRWIAVAGIALVLLSAVLSGQVVWVQAVGNPLPVALVQGNIPQSLKWSPEWQVESVQRYRDLTLSAPPAVLVVWPETALPALLSEMRDFTEPFADLLATRGTTVLSGVPTYDTESGQFFNSVAELGRGGGVYNKRHLVPFGEFLPLRELLVFFHSYVEIPMADFSAGAPAQSPLMVSGQVLGTSVCYEIIFGEEIRRSLPAARVLVNVSNDAWFGDSSAAHQHLEMARMRALETGRQMLRATNDGITAIIDQYGWVQSRIARSRQGVLSGQVVPMAGATPYVRHGIWGTLGLLTLMLLAALALRWRNRSA